MSDTVFTNAVTLTDADWFNDVNRLHYTILGDPATASAVASKLGTLTTVASATTPDIFATTVGQLIDYTGTATCTGFVAAPQAGAERTLVCAGAAVFTAGANMLIDGVASGSNFTAATGDKIVIRAVTTTQFRLTAQKYNGTAVVAPSAPIFTVSYASGDQTITSAGTLTLTHSLGAVPKFVVATLVCGTAEVGYSIADQLEVVVGSDDTYSLGHGFSLCKTSTQLVIRFGSDTNVFAMPHKTTGARTNLTNGSWTIQFRAYA